MRRIDILYFDGCPNHLPAVEMARDVVAELGIDAEINEIEVTGPDDAIELRFLGSPSIHVDGVDVELSARARTDFGFSCRTYSGKGLPDRGYLIAALGNGHSHALHDAENAAGADCCEHQNDERAQPDRSMLGLAASGGSVVAAMVASACCWLPLTFVALGFSVGSIGALFETTRPYFLATAAVLLGVGFYVVYLRKEECAPGSACETSDKASKSLARGMLWLSTLGVAAFASFPLYVDIFHGEPAGASVGPSENAALSIEMQIDGMTCAGCAVAVEKALMNVTHVLDANVDHESGTASLAFSTKSTVPVERLLKAVASAGFRAHITKSHPKFEELKEEIDNED